MLLFALALSKLLQFSSNFLMSLGDEKLSEYDQEIPQSHNADQPTAA